MTVSWRSLLLTPARLPCSCTDTNNRAQRRFYRSPYLSIHNFVGLVKHLPPLAVTQHDVTNKEIAQHRRGNFGGKWWRDHHFDRRHVANFEQQIFDELSSLSLQHVHLPVSSDDFFSHSKIMVIPSEAEGSRCASLKVTFSGSLGYRS